MGQHAAASNHADSKTYKRHDIMAASRKISKFSYAGPDIQLCEYLVKITLDCE